MQYGFGVPVNIWKKNKKAGDETCLVYTCEKKDLPKVKDTKKSGDKVILTDKAMEEIFEGKLLPADIVFIAEDKLDDGEANQFQKEADQFINTDTVIARYL
jgi:hypothetical protein